jgi:glycosyltransferase involved in cell wall biosynthesis
MIEMRGEKREAISDAGEITSSGKDASGSVGVETRPKLFLDLSDLVEYAKHNGTLSGIQRVVSSILTYAEEWAAENDSYDIVPVVPEYDMFRVFSVNFRKVLAMIQLIEEGRDSGRPKINAAIEALYQSRVEVFPRRGDMLIIAGAFWIYAHYDLIMRLRAKGVLFGLFVHDLIQIKYPEYVHKEATQTFRRSLVDALEIADFVLTNSHFVAGEVAEFMSARLGLSLPVTAVPLATELRLKPSGNHEAFPVNIRETLARDYVLCVGTIEVRKNHLLLVKIWEQLARELSGRLPDLVFVGKWGWDIAPLRSLLEKTNYLNDRIRIVTNASDAALTELYRHCLMTAYVSFAEGFGLPVGESLAYGKPCVASRTTSLPEVGDRFARYIDPDDSAEGVETFKALLGDRGTIERWSADILANYKPKTWRTFTREFLDACVKHGAMPRHGRSPNNCLLPARAMYRIGNSDIAMSQDNGRLLSTFRMARDAGWHAIEDWGCWSAKSESSLWLRTNLPEGTDVVVGLNLRAPPGSRDAGATVRINKSAAQSFPLYRSATWNVVSGKVGEGGALHVTFDCVGDFGRPDSRDLYVGILALEIQDRRAEAKSSLARRAVTSRVVALTRQTAARWRRRARLHVPHFMLEPVRQAARAATDERLAVAGRHSGGHSLRVVGPRGQTDNTFVMAIPAIGVLRAPEGLYMTAANCLARDFYCEQFTTFCSRAQVTPNLHRRIWEYAFVARRLEVAKALGPGRRGLAISLPDDPLPALFEAAGCVIDRASDIGDGPESTSRYDFLWSIDTSLRGPPSRVIEGVVNLVERKLKEGGTAIFTDDLNLTAYERGGDESEALARADIEQMKATLSHRGHKVEPLPFELGLTALDTLVELPPFTSGVHLKILQNGFAIGTFGLAVSRGPLGKGEHEFPPPTAHHRPVDSRTSLA